MQNLTTVSHTTFAHVGGSKRFLGRWSPAPWDGRVADPWKDAPPLLTYVTMPDLVVLSPTVRAYVLRTVLFIKLLSCLRSNVVILDTLIVLLTY